MRFTRKNMRVTRVQHISLSAFSLSRVHCCCLNLASTAAAAARTFSPGSSSGEELAGAAIILFFVFFLLCECVLSSPEKRLFSLLSTF